MRKFLLFCLAITAVASVFTCYNINRTYESLRIVHANIRAAQENQAPDLISEADMKKWAGELASDAYTGRQAGYEGNNKAARYIAKQFSKMGIKPAGDLMEDNIHRDYFQRFRFNTDGTGSVDLTTQNVVGVIEGSDPELKKQIIVLGAHFDHVGQVGEGYHYARMGRLKGIWHGADDNASGTVTVMSIAKAFAQGRVAAKRTVVFILFSAEEGGLLGSRFYTDHPTVGKIEDYVFMLNLDMIGRNPEKPTEIKGMGSAFGSYLRDVVTDAVSTTKLDASIQAGAEVEGGDSDHSSFAEHNVPFVFFFTGFHPDYHRVTDTADKLAYGHMALIGKTSFLMLI